MTWAKRSLLEDRVGSERVLKLATRRVWNESLSTYVDDSSDEVTNKSIDQALESAKSWILFTVSCCYDSDRLLKNINDGAIYPMLLEYHLRLTSDFLKWGGDCSECDSLKKEFTDLCKCGSLMDSEGNSLKRKTKFAVTDNKLCIPESYCNLCCEEGCKCK